LSQYTFRTDRQTDRPTDGIDDRSMPLALTLPILIESDALIIICLGWQVAVDGDRTSLEMDEVLLEDAGSYCVTASNLAGDARTSCHVDVIASSLPRQPGDRRC